MIRAKRKESGTIPDSFNNRIMFKLSNLSVEEYHELTQPSSPKSRSDEMRRSHKHQYLYKGQHIDLP